MNLAFAGAPGAVLEEFQDHDGCGFQVRRQRGQSLGEFTHPCGYCPCFLYSGRVADALPESRLSLLAAQLGFN